MKPTAVDPRKPYLNLRWNLAEVDDMRKMWAQKLGAIEIPRRFTKAGRLTSASEINEIALRNRF